MTLIRCLTLTFLSVAMISGCVTKPDARPPVSGFCDYAEPIYYSREDNLTPETKRQIVRHDEVGELLCGWNGKPKTPVSTT